MEARFNSKGVLTIIPENKVETYALSAYIKENVKKGTKKTKIINEKIVFLIGN